MMINEVIIFGGHIQALGLARQARDLRVDVTLCLPDGLSVARYSNAVGKVKVCRGEAEQLCYLEERSGGGRHILLFPTSDEAVEFLAQNYDALNPLFYVGIPSPQTAETFADKRKAAKFAADNGIAAPRTWLLESLSDLDAHKDEFDYPMVLKPAVMHSFHKIFGKKAYRCDSFEDLKAEAERVARKFPINLLMAQEFLDGGPKNLYSYGCLADGGEPRAAVIANRIRQNPYFFGNSTTFAVTQWSEEIEAEAKKILKAARYTGLAEIEFMRDPATGNYKFLELNARAWKWHGISGNFGFGFLAEYIKLLNGKGGAAPTVDYSEPRAWVERLTDMAVSAKAIARGYVTLAEVRRSYRIPKASAVLSRRDPLPALMYLLLSPALFFKRH